MRRVKGGWEGPWLEIGGPIAEDRKVYPWVGEGSTGESRVHGSVEVDPWQSG